VAGIKTVVIEVEVFVKETDDYLFALSDHEKYEVAEAVESQLNSIKADNYRNDWTILGTQVKNVIK
jgi:hypothetical protein